jgi:peptide/nickel transport system substrate-binding protein
MKRLSRKRFLEVAGVASAGAVMTACAPAATPAPTAAPAPTQAPAATKAPAPTQAPAATAAPAGGKILKVRLYQDVSNLDPANRTGFTDENIDQCVMSGLVTYGANSYDIVNDLVESIQQSADGKTITFKLRQGVKWQNGYGEVTTEDVKYSYERFLDPALKAAYKDDWAVLDRVEIVDKYNGKIILKEPFAPLWRTTLPVGSGLIVCKKFVEEIGAQKFATNIIGCGPYIFAEWKPKQRVVLKRNPDYFGKAPYWDEIHLFPINEDKAGEVALEAGEVDFGRISTAAVTRFSANTKLKVLRKPALRYRWISMNVEHPKLRDINVRQAIRYAIDVPSIVKAGYMGQAEQEFSLIAPGLIGYWKDAPKYARDVAKAKDFLKKANVTTLDLKIGLPDTVEYKTWCEIAQQNLKEVGINLTINTMDQAQFDSIGMGDKGKEVELLAMNYSMQPDPSWATMWFTCEQVNVWNWMRWCSKEYDDLHKKGLTTTDNAEREKIYIQMQKLWDEACHSIFITHGSMDFAYNPKIKPAVTPHGVLQINLFEPA